MITRTRAKKLTFSPITPADAAEANTWAAAIKGRFPGRSISVMAIACYSIEMNAPGDRGHDWNAELYPALGDAIDGVTIHPYLHVRPAAQSQWSAPFPQESPPPAS